MLAREKKHRIEGQFKIHIWDGRKKMNFSFPKSLRGKIIRILESVDSADLKSDAVPADEVFKNLYSKYTKPGVALRGGRGKEGLTQKQLAEKLGIEQGDLSKMETGKRPISRKIAQKLADILKMNYRAFL